MSIMLGVTWIPGLFRRAEIFVQIVFDVFTCLQEFFICLIFVVFQEDARKVLCCGCCEGNGMAGRKVLCCGCCEGNGMAGRKVLCCGCCEGNGMPGISFFSGKQASVWIVRIKTFQ